MPNGAISRILVVLPANLVSLFPGCARQVTLSAATVGDAINELDVRWPGMRDRICDTRPAIRRHMNVFVDGERATLDTRLGSGAEILIMTAVSGG